MSEVTQSEEYDFTDLRVEQARLLKERVLPSCLIVLFVISYTAIIMMVAESVSMSWLWIAVSVPMVGVVFLYARLKAREGINRENVYSYLTGHTIISSCTGMVWGGFAIYNVGIQTELSLFLSCLIVASITTGGILPSSIYRPGFVGLALFALVPFGIYVLLYFPGALRLVGLGIMVQFLFSMYTSAKVEIDTRDSIAARHTRALTDKVIAQNAIIKMAHEEKNRFLAATSHDLSQPLHAQGFFIKALSRSLSKNNAETDSELVADQKDLIRKIESSWRNQTQLLQGLVDITRIESGAIVPHIQLFDVAQEMQNLMNEFVDDKSNSITFETQFESALVKTDPVLLGRIIRNLLTNANKFTPAGGTVSLTVAKGAENVDIVVADNGPGIAPIEQSHIFEEYVQLGNDDNRRKNGMGLGLSIVRKLSDLLDLDLSLESEIGAGTIFKISLPLREQTLVVDRDIAGRADEFPNTPLIVVVDDDPDVCDSMATLLSAWNCQVVDATNQKDAIEKLDHIDALPALLIIDKNLGNEESGLDLIQALREEVNEMTPAVLMSGDLSGQEHTEIPYLVQMLNKPVDPTEIERIIYETVGH